MANNLFGKNPLFTCTMKNKGDIPEEDDVRPAKTDATLVSDEAKYKVQLVDEIIDSGGIAHVYTGHTPPGEDKHLYEFNTHRFPKKGLIYYHADDKDVWIYGGDIELVERHYEE